MGYQLIETISVGSGGANSLEWLNVPNDGVDLVLLVSARTTESQRSVLMRLQLNNDSTQGNYYYHDLLGNGDNVYAGKGTFQTPVTTQGNTSTSNTFSNTSIYISNYASSTSKRISVDTVTENNATNADTQIVSGSYTTTSAISRIKFYNASETLLEHSTASLYKITAD
tara:strand:+ start:435 stop:941 length:507 start_codon:yes stop_codon:yes gene_type:complete